MRWRMKYENGRIRMYPVHTGNGFLEDEIFAASFYNETDDGENVKHDAKTENTHK